jgi:hypothetical protein
MAHRHHGRRYRWQLRGVTFDEAFRRGIGGAAQVLSNNGEPGAGHNIDKAGRDGRRWGKKSST